MFKSELQTLSKYFQNPTNGLTLVSVLSQHLLILCVSVRVSFDVVLKGCFMSDLHTGECIHGCYFIAGPSIHAVGGVHPLTKVSVICSNRATFQVRVKKDVRYLCTFLFF